LRNAAFQAAGVDVVFFAIATAAANPKRKTCRQDAGVPKILASPTFFPARHQSISIFTFLFSAPKEPAMSRGAQRTVRQETEQQLGQQNQLISQANQSGQQDRSLLMPTISSLLNSQGYTPAQQSAITQQSLGAANTAFDALRERAANRQAATNNSAGYGDLTAQLGREQAQTDASQAQQNQIAFANQQLKEQLAGLSALGQTYGIDTNLLGRAMGVPAQLLGVQQRAAGGSSTSGLGSMLGLGSSIASLFG
jgi:hypothetical protein